MAQIDAKKIIRIISVIVALLGGGVGYEIVTDDSPKEPAQIESTAERPAESAERSVPKSAAPKSVVVTPSKPESVKSESVKSESAKPAVAKGETQKIVVKSSPAKSVERKRCVFASFRDGEWVTGWGTVKKILPDDTVPPCHQRFLLVDPTGETLLVANNIDRWQRLGDLHVGDIVEFKGEFKDTERGYLVHWTHPDTSRRRPGGYVRKGR